MDDEYHQLLANLKVNDELVNFQSKFTTNLSPKQSNSKKINAFGEMILQKDFIIKLRIKFQKLLGKLNHADTKDIAFNELQMMINKYNDQESLRIYLSLIAIYYPNCTLASKELQVLLLGYLASVYKENFVDPLDKPQSIFSTINRAFNILTVFMKENSLGIHKAISHSLLEIFDNCFPKDETETVFVLIINPLILIIQTGTNKFEQLASSICLNDLCRFIFNIKMPLVNEKLAPLIQSVILNNKIRCENQYIFQTLCLLIENLNICYFTANLKEIYDKIIQILNESKNYQTKIECCKIISSLCLKLISDSDLIIGYYSNDILICLQNACKDRINKVQVSAHEALKLWLDLQRLYEEYEIQKTTYLKDQKLDNGKSTRPESKLNLLRNISKRNNLIQNRKEYSPDLVREEIYKKGISNVMNNNNFIKRNSLNRSKENFKTKNQNSEMKSSIRNFIKSKNSNYENSQNYFKEKVENHDSPNIKPIEKSEINEKPSENKLLNILKDKFLIELNQIIDSNQEKIEMKFGILDERLSRITETVNKIIKNNEIPKSIRGKELTQHNSEDIQDNKVKNSQIEEKNNNILQIWEDALKEISTKNYEKAYKIILDSDDDLYLLRLVYLTKNYLEILSKEIFYEVLIRMNRIARSYQIQSIILDLIQKSVDKNFFYEFNEESQNEILENLYEFSGYQGDFGKEAAFLYTKITSYYN